MTFNKTYGAFALTSSLIILGSTVEAQQTTQQELELPKAQIFSDTRLNMEEETFKHLQQAYAEYSELQAMYEDLQTNYDELQGYMNLLLESPVFNPSDVTIPSNAHIYQIKYALQDTELMDLASTFIEAEKTYNVNAFFLIGLVCLESSYGRSDRALNDNNLSGYAVYNDNSVGKKFVSKEASIMETARLIAEDYLPDGARFHTGKSIHQINQMYSADPEWANKIINIANRKVNEAKMWGVIEYE